MKRIIYFLFSLMFLPIYNCYAQQMPAFTYKIEKIPASVKILMEKYTWRPGCPVALNQLAYIKLSYWGFDQKKHMGVLIVNKALASQTVAIFKHIYYQKFPIARMQPMYMFKGDDNAAMAVNNSSSFNCRPITGETGKFSEHSYGRAIDINTLINPYINGSTVLPPAGRNYLDRSKVVPGMITQNDAVYNDFISRGWAWGGNWHSLKDYQHFEKPAEISSNS